MSKLAALVRVTPYNEPIDCAIKSILKLKHEFKQVFIFTQGASGVVGAKYQSDLEHAGLELVVTRRYPKKLGEDVYALVEVPPNCEVDGAAFEELLQVVEDNKNQVNLVHFTLESELEDESFSLAHGYLLVLYWVEYMWWAFEWFKLPLDRFVRLRFVVSKGKQRVVAPWQFAWRLWNTGQARTIHCNQLVTLKASPRLCGFHLVKNSIYRHELVGNWRSPIGNFWMVLWWFFYFGLVAQLIVRNQTLLIVYSTIHVLITWASWVVIGRRLHVRFFLFYCLVHPVYFLTFPFVVLVGRLSQPEKNWKQK